MPLPDLLEIVPLASPPQAQVTVPGSKSITNRALILAALADGETELHGALWSEDTQVMVDCLQTLGVEVTVAADPDDLCNRLITVVGTAGEVPAGGSAVRPLELFVGNAGTAARFLAAFLCLGSGVYRLHGVPRMHERPQRALFEALRALGYRIDSAQDRLPATIYGGSRRPGKCRVGIGESSQFASALLLCSQVGGWQVEVSGENAEESPYVRMTSELLAVFPTAGGHFQIEPDASSASYFWAAASLMLDAPDPWSSSTVSAPELPVTIRSWTASDWQIDTRFPHCIFPPKFFESPQAGTPPRSPRELSRILDLGDSIMTAVVLAPFWREPVVFKDLGRLRVQECERVRALKTELEKCGARVTEEGESLTLFPSGLHGAEIDTYNDHRMAMCFATLGLKVAGMRIRNPACVKKTFPNFFQKLALANPEGLGATLLDGKRGRKMLSEDLFAV